MVETRIAPRHRVMKPAKIDYGGYKIPCTIRDLSTTGSGAGGFRSKGDSCDIHINRARRRIETSLPCGLAQTSSDRHRVRLGLLKLANSFI